MTAKKAKLFEVYRSGVCLMSTEYEEAIPKHETLLQMQKLGYTFKREGKAWRPSRRKHEQSYAPIAVQRNRRP